MDGGVGHGRSQGLRCWMCRPERSVMRLHSAPAQGAEGKWSRMCRGKLSPRASWPKHEGGATSRKGQATRRRGYDIGLRPSECLGKVPREAGHNWQIWARRGREHLNNLNVERCLSSGCKSREFSSKATCCAGAPAVNERCRRRRLWRLACVRSCRTPGCTESP